MKICFISSVFGKSYNEVDKPGKFETNSEYDYCLFTNLDPKKFNTSWNVINVNHVFDNTTIQSNIIKSRYPKFMGFKLLRDVVKKDYDVVFYCDAILCPKHNVNWKEHANTILKHPSGIMQMRHGRDSYQELSVLVGARKDNKERVEKTKQYLERNKFPKGIPMPENTVFGYNPKHERLTATFTEFWNEYSTYNTSHRDQPLWSYFLWKHKLTPHFFKRSRDMMKQLFESNARIGFRGHSYI